MDKIKIEIRGLVIRANGIRGNGFGKKILGQRHSGNCPFRPMYRNPANDVNLIQKNLNATKLKLYPKLPKSLPELHVAPNKIEVKTNIEMRTSCYGISTLQP